MSRTLAPGWRVGARAVVPFLLPVLATGVSFGLLARTIGWSPWAAIAMSLLVFSASGQLAAVAVIHEGGSSATAIVAGLLAHLRYLPMAAGVTPSLRGSRWRRALEAQSVVDLSWLLARRDDGTFDREVLIAATLPQYGVWAVGTALGAFLGDGLIDPERFGLDVVFPAFFAFLLVGELRRPGTWRTSLLALALGLAVVPFAPPGVPIIVASAAALVDLDRRRRRAP